MKKHPSGIFIGKRFKLKENTMSYWHITDRRIKEELALLEKKEEVLI